MNIAHYVTCFYCGQRFDRDKIPFQPVGARRYAHADCSERAIEQQQKENADKERLMNYLTSKFGDISKNTKIQKQLKFYLEQNGYTYSGIYKALYYFYDIKKNPIEKANNGIGILPYIWEEAYTYYYDLWLAQQKNQDKNINDYVPQVEEVHILRPQRKIRRHRFFSFLDEEES